MDIDYNTSRESLIIKEYGRNVQELVKYALSIEDRDKRTKLAHIIVSVMQQVNPSPNNGTTDEYFKKLWNHLYMISEYKLDIDYPFEVSENEIINHNPEHVDYKDNDIRFRFYGKNTELILKGIAEIEEGPERMALLVAMANQMKEMYISWNKSIVGDDVVSKHIDILSNGKLSLPEGLELISSNEVLRKLRAELDLKEKESSNNGKKNYKKSAPKRKQKTFKKKSRY